jgi:hypothetical protein
MSSPEFLLFLLILAIAIAVIAGQIFALFINRLHQWRNERAISRAIDRDDEPPLAI